MPAPAFWDRRGPLARGLLPLAWIWRAATTHRLRTGRWEQCPVPVICVGNLTVGGSGKTPVVAALMQRLAAEGITAHAVSRGYGGRLTGPVQVDIGAHRARDVGDEPLLLAAFGSAWISTDRAAGVRAAADSGAEVVILDDGFQNPSIAKDLSLLVVDAETGFGNGYVMPAGPLREPVEAGLARADAVIAIGSAACRERLATTWPQINTRPLLAGRLVPLETGMDWAGLRCLAFAGIGRPTKFFATLSALGAEVVATRAFPDHATYSHAILKRLSREAAEQNLQLVTTEKDAVRLPQSFRPNVLALPVRLDLDDWPTLDTLVWGLLGKKNPPDEPAGK